MGSQNWLLKISLRRTSLVAQLVKNPPAIQIMAQFLIGKIAWRRGRLLIPILFVFPGFSDSKETACTVGDLSSIPGLGKCPGGGHGNPLQYGESILDSEIYTGVGNPLQLTLAWEIPWIDEPVSYSLWGCKESDMTKQLSIQHRYMDIQELGS